MLRARSIATVAVLLLGPLAAGCGNVESTLEGVAQFFLREA